MDLKKPSIDILRQAIEDIKEPAKFINIINVEDKNDSWNLLRLENLKISLGNISLPFRVGKNAKTDTPQWDISCPIEMMTLSEFLERNTKKEIDGKWYYFDYKYMHEWLKNKPELLTSPYWRAFGFNQTGQDSTLWIGSKGAHTNCHQDSYGCNLIGQIHGRKEWLLFPPESGNILKQTRVPYEESTIYSELNFFSPSKEDEKAILKIDKKPISVILEPGDVLFVPKGWWHYVESLDLSVSINVWLPLKTDCEARLKEALVNLIMTRLGEELPSAEKSPSTLEESIKLIEVCLDECNKMKFDTEEYQTEKKMKKTEWTTEDLAREFPNFVETMNYLSETELKDLLSNKRNRFAEIKDFCEEIPNTNCENSSSHVVLKSVVDSICHSDIIDKISEMLLNTNC